MPTRGTRNNILAGLFVVVSLVLGVGIAFFLSNRPTMGGMRRFTVQFSLQDGATGLKRGSPVQLAGQPIGRVRSVTFARNSENVPGAVNVEVEVNSNITLYENAAVYLQLPLLGTLSSINITNVGTPNYKPFTGTSALIEENEVVAGHIAPPGFLAQAGFGAEQAEQLRMALSSMERAIARVGDLIDTNGPKLDAGISDAQALLAQLRIKLSDWSKEIDATAANIKQASGKLDPMLDEANGAIKDIREVIASNRDKLSQIMTNLQSTTTKIDQKTIDEVNAAIKQGRDALGAFADSMGSLNTVVKEETPGVRHTLANLRLMSDQLKLTSVEVRSQPWRLLHSPTTKEMSSQMLYDATRAYAEAASDLRAASEALAAVGDKGPSVEMAEQLTRAVDKYKRAEAALMDRLITEERK
jgi:ABC-type transporter Mla subunit MlaD